MLYVFKLLKNGTTCIKFTTLGIINIYKSMGALLLRFVLGLFGHGLLFLTETDVSTVPSTVIISVRSTARIFTLMVTVDGDVYKRQVIRSIILDYVFRYPIWNRAPNMIPPLCFVEFQTNISRNVILNARDKHNTRRRIIYFKISCFNRYLFSS